MKKFMGRHLIVDVYGVRKDILQNKTLLKRMLGNLPTELEMRILKQPSVYEIKSETHSEVGFSGFVILYESHVSFHTWPEDSFIAIDVYSCNDFDRSVAINFIKKTLDVKKVQFKSIIRG
jgi:S-adenosylmethionine decarboxylase